MLKIIVGALVLLGLTVAFLIWTIIVASKRSDNLIAR